MSRSDLINSSVSHIYSVSAIVKINILHFKYYNINLSSECYGHQTEAGFGQLGATRSKLLTDLLPCQLKEQQRVLTRSGLFLVSFLTTNGITLNLEAYRLSVSPVSRTTNPVLTAPGPARWRLY